MPAIADIVACVLYLVLAGPSLGWVAEQYWTAYTNYILGM